MPPRFNRWTKPPNVQRRLSRSQLRGNAVAIVRATLQRGACETDMAFAMRSLSEVFAAQDYVAAPPAAPALIAATEERLRVTLPQDLRAIALFADGSGEGVDNSGCDIEGIRLWPLSEWVLDKIRPTRIVIADYREECWWYSVAANGDTHPGAVSIAGYTANESPTLYASVAGFLEACAFDRLFDPLSDLRAQFGNS